MMQSKAWSNNTSNFTLRSDETHTVVLKKLHCTTLCSLAPQTNIHRSVVYSINKKSPSIWRPARGSDDSRVSVNNTLQQPADSRRKSSGILVFPCGPQSQEEATPRVVVVVVETGNRWLDGSLSVCVAVCSCVCVSDRNLELYWSLWVKWVTDAANN